MSQQNMLYQQKFDKSAKWADSAINTLCQQKLIKMTDDESAKNSWVSKNLLSQQKLADSAKYAVSAKFG